MEVETNEEIELLPMCCELNLLTQSDGSAMLCEGNTTMLASVHGPVEVKLQKLQIEKATIETYYKPPSGLSGVSDRVIELFLKNICEVSIYCNMYARTAITIIIQELEEDGYKLACATNSCCLALINSGLSMRFLVAAVTCALDENKKFHFNASIKLLNPVATFTFVFENINYNIVASQTSGSFTDDEYQDAINKCKIASEKVFQFYRSVVTKYSNKIGKKTNVT